MVRRLALAAVFVATGSLIGLPAQQATSPSSQQSPTPVFRTGAAFVRVDVYPSKDGRIVPGLAKEAFQIFEDGKPQTIETFDFVDFPTFASEEERRDPATKEEGDALAADPRNRVFVVYLDTFNVTIEEARHTRVPLVATLDRTIGPSDVYGVLTPQQTYADLVFGRKVKSTADMLERHWTWGESEHPVVDDAQATLLRCYTGLMETETLDHLLRRERLDRTFKRLSQLVEYLGRLRQERKNVLLFTHGWDLAGPAEYLLTAIRRAPQPATPGVSLGGKVTIGDRSRGDMPESTCEGERGRLAGLDFLTEFRELMKAARRANVSFYPVNPAGLSAEMVVSQAAQRGAGIETAVDHLRELAVNTDGIAVVDTNDLRTAMSKITDSLSAYYLIGYYPTNAKQDGSLREITVKGPPGMALKARRSYRAANDKDASATRGAAASAASASAATIAAADADLDAAFAELARVSASRAEITGRATMTSRSQLHFVAESSRAVTSDVDVQLILTDQFGEAVATGRGRIAVGTRAVAIRATVPAAAVGPLQAIMRISGGDTRGGDTVPVRAPDGLLADAQLTRIDGATATPVAAPVFSRRERLRASWTMMGAGALTRRDARVLDRRGQPLPVASVV
nr:VWA domain-containing protein [Acidobacteriota bacterium]